MTAFPCEKSARRVRSAGLQTVRLRRFQSAWRYRRINRRVFLAGAVGSAFAASSLQGAAAEAPSVGPTTTLFFNLSNSDNPASGHYLYLAGARHVLQPVTGSSAILQQARSVNAFLSRVPDQAITHAAVGITLPSNVVTLGYVFGNVDQASGAYSLLSLVHYLPPPAILACFDSVLAYWQAANQSYPRSVKRITFGLPAATSAAEVIEEHQYFDSSDHARTLIGLHPDLLTAEPASAAYVHVNFIETDQFTVRLSQTIESLGPATAAVKTGQPNEQGWATLIPYTKDDGYPVRTSSNLNVYDPQFHPEVDTLLARTVYDVNPRVKDDTTLGADCTGSELVSGDAFNGKLWYRHDGAPNVAQSSSSTSSTDDDSPNVSFLSQNSMAGLQIWSNPTVTSGSGSAVTVNIPGIVNWFLRFLSVYVVFRDANGNPLDPDNLGNILPAYPRDKALEASNGVFAGVLPAPFTVAGIPVDGGHYSLTLNLPENVAGFSLYLGGAGFLPPPGDTDNKWIIPGAVLTVVVNYAFVTLCMIAGALPNIDPILRFLGITVLSEIILPLVTLAGSDAFEGGNINVVQVVSALGRAFLNGVTGQTLARLIALMTAQIVVEQIADDIPAINLIARVISAVVGGAQLAETSIELALSPRIYQFDLSLSHSVTLNIKPQDGEFPPVIPGQEVLYYKIVYMFASGVPPLNSSAPPLTSGAPPHTLPLTDVADPSNLPSIPVSINNIPRGGQIEVRVSFYIRPQGSSPDDASNFCAAQGTTGLVDNSTATLPDIVLTENQRPITHDTEYAHVMKSALNPNQTHYWLETAVPPAYAPPEGNEQPGSLGALRNITVRQETSTSPGYVGYAWQSYSANVTDCITPDSPQQLDLVANLNTSPDNNGADAQSGYAISPRGLDSANGASIAYSLFSSNAQNFFLEPATLMLRQIPLLQPAFPDPCASGPVSFGKLNFDSDKIVLHPSGYFVSINSEFHKCESHPLAAQGVPDAQAPQLLLARGFSGKGSRPGLINTPRSVAASHDGVVLILEDSGANNRIQAMDVAGNPVKLFSKQPVPYFLVLTQTASSQYLDIAVEFTGFIYVLSQNGNDFRVDIYHPDQDGQSPLSTTHGIFANNIAIDYWRGLYTLNYEVLTNPDGTLPSLTEPSISYWYPSLPTSTGRPPRRRPKPYGLPVGRIQPRA